MTDKIRKIIPINPDLSQRQFYVKTDKKIEKQAEQIVNDIAKTYDLLINHLSVKQTGGIFHLDLEVTAKQDPTQTVFMTQTDFAKSEDFAKSKVKKISLRLSLLDNLSSQFLKVNAKIPDAFLVRINTHGFANDSYEIAKILNKQKQSADLYHDLAYRLARDSYIRTHGELKKKEKSNLIGRELTAGLFCTWAKNEWLKNPTKMVPDACRLCLNMNNIVSFKRAMIKQNENNTNLAQINWKTFPLKNLQTLIREGLGI